MKRKTPLIFLSLLVLTCFLFTNLILALAKSPQMNGNSGAIWTTRDDCGSEKQNVNHYEIGEHVYINGANFNPGDYYWKIKGQPGGASCDPRQIVADGTFAVDESGSFCFDAYTVQEDDCGEYKVKFGNKGDNYRVIGVTTTTTSTTTTTTTTTTSTTTTTCPTSTTTTTTTTTTTPSTSSTTTTTTCPTTSTTTSTTTTTSSSTTTSSTTTTTPSTSSTTTTFCPTTTTNMCGMPYLQDCGNLNNLNENGENLNTEGQEDWYNQRITRILSFLRKIAKFFSIE